MIRAADHTEECASWTAAIRQRAGRFLRERAAWSRAATSPERFPAEPPDTNVPPASGGRPARSANHRSAWFSA